MKDKRKFGEIDVERINIVDADGKIRMVLSGKDRSHGWVFRGKEYPGRPEHAGVIFFNDDGEECGGLIFGNRGAGLMFDRFDQDQIIGLIYDEEDGHMKYGLHMWDRPDGPIGEMMDRFGPIRDMPDGPEKSRLLSEFSRDYPSPMRVFLGREKTADKDETRMVLTDKRGRARVRALVDSDDQPKIEILDEDGNVTYQIPPK